jgi:transcriptional regulator with XRE-family HTH domain
MDYSNFMSEDSSLTMDDSLSKVFSSYREVIDALGGKEDSKVSNVLKKYSEAIDEELEDIHIKNTEKFLESLESLNKSELIRLCEANNIFTSILEIKGITKELLDLFKWFINIIDTVYDEELKRKVAVSRIKQSSFIVDTINTLDDKVVLIDSLIKDERKIVFSAKLSKLAKNKGLNQSDIARELKVRQQTVSDWYCGKVLPSIPTVINIAIFLDTSIDYLVREDVEDSNLSNDFLLKSVGLDPLSSETLWKLNSNNPVIATLNVLIHNYHYEKESSLINTLADFLQPFVDDKLFVVSEEDLKDLMHLLRLDNQTPQDKINTINTFENKLMLEKRNSPLSVSDTSSAYISKIIQSLTILKNDIIRDNY